MDASRSELGRLIRAAYGRPMLEIDDLDACACVGGDDATAPAAFQQLDLRHSIGFESGTFEACLFLSCLLTPAQAGYLTTTGATVIRDGDERPFSVHRSQLYTPEELFAGFDPASAPDGYDHDLRRGGVPPLGRRPAGSIPIDRREPRPPAARPLDHRCTPRGDRGAAARRDHGRSRIGARRPEVRVDRTGSPARSRVGRLMLSGGGPGAMEATHLGAWMAHFDDDELDDAIAMLSPRPAGAAPGREYADPDWLDPRVRRPPSAGRSTHDPVRIDRHPDVDVRA